MIEKRFNIEDGYDQGKSSPIKYDEESSDDYYFCGDYEDFKSICEQFNDFDIENKNLKKENNLYKDRISLLSSLLDLADAIIDTSDNEKAKQVWGNKNEQTEREWGEILNDWF